MSPDPKVREKIDEKLIENGILDKVLRDKLIDQLYSLSAIVYKQYTHELSV